MRVLGKFVVCLALLLAVGVVALARPLPALAVWGDDNEPMPVLFGLELGGDIREHPELVVEPYSTAAFDFPEDWGKGAMYEGIPVYPKHYRIFDYKISFVSFLIKVKDFPRFREVMSWKFGNEMLRDENYEYIFLPGYYWGKYEVEIQARYPFMVDAVYISFSYLPLDNQIYFGSHAIPDSFTYHGVTLGRKAEEYPFLHPIKEETPDIVYYQSSKPPRTFDEDKYWEKERVEPETWLAYQGIIYSLELRLDESEECFVVQQLIDTYRPKPYPYSIYSMPEVRLSDYTLYFKGPGLTIITHMPTYWRMLRAKTGPGE